jgi:hypothetical protein
MKLSHAFDEPHARRLFAAAGKLARPPEALGGPETGCAAKKGSLTARGGGMAPAVGQLPPKGEYAGPPSNLG